MGCTAKSYLEPCLNEFVIVLEIEKESVREVVRGGKHNLKKSANRKAQISVIHPAYCAELCFAICRFSRDVFFFHLEQLHAHLLSYFQ